MRCKASLLCKGSVVVNMKLTVVVGTVPCSNSLYITVMHFQTMMTMQVSHRCQCDYDDKFEATKLRIW